jgi:hypothetical protein
VRRLLCAALLAALAAAPADAGPRRGDPDRAPARGSGARPVVKKPGARPARRVRPAAPPRAVDKPAPARAEPTRPRPPAARPPAVPASPSAAPVASLDQRVAYLAGLLAAVRAGDPRSLADTARYVRAVERNKCQAPEPSLRVGCLLEAVAQNCPPQAGDARERCLRVSDVLVSNLLGEPIFLPREVRFELMGRHKDYRAALARELYRRHAVLVTEFAMSGQFPGSGAGDEALARGIEAYCRETAGTRDLSWQYCAAAAVWFIGTDGRAMHEEQRR